MIYKIYNKNLRDTKNNSSHFFNIWSQRECSSPSLALSTFLSPDSSQCRHLCMLLSLRDESITISCCLVFPALGQASLWSPRASIGHRWGFLDGLSKARFFRFYIRRKLSLTLPRKCSEHIHKYTWIHYSVSNNMASPTSTFYFISSR